MAELVDHFGPERVASWYQPVLVCFSLSLVRIRINGGTFHAERVPWGHRPHEYGWTLWRGGRVRRGRRRGGEHIASYGRALEAVVAAVERAPPMPPDDWTFDAWRLRSGVVL